jgi:hemoglobin/transferrin/lactoferrin receptor protein
MKLLFFLFIPFAFWAQSPQMDTLQNVIVSASRQSISTQKTPFTTYRINRSEKSSRNTPDLLLNSPGVFLQKTNHGGGSAFVRGLTGNQTLLVVDGIRFNNSTFRYGPNQYLNTIDAFSLSHIELLKGSGSVQYGSDALTGVLHFFTEKPEFSTTSTWRNTLGTRWAGQGMELSWQAKSVYSSEKTALLVSGSTRQFGDITRGNGRGFQTPTGYDEWSYLAKIRQKVNTNWTLEGLLQTTTQSHVPVYHKVVLENFLTNEMDLQRYQKGYVRAQGLFDSKAWREVELTVSRQSSLENRKLQKKGSATLRAESDEIETWGITGQVKSVLGKNWSAVSGFDYYQDAVQSTRADLTNGAKKSLRGLYPNGSSYAYQSIFSLHHIDLDRWQIEAGLRYHTGQANLPDTTVGKTRIQMGALVYSLGLTRLIGDQWALFAQTNSGFRAPNLDDLGSLGIVDFRYELPALDLKPEYSQNFELGLKWQHPRFRNEISVYRTQLVNLITRIKTAQMIQGYSVFVKQNVDEAYVTGAEWAGSYDLHPNWKIQSQVSYVLGQNVTQNEPLRRIPPIHGGLKVMRQQGNFQTSAELVFAGEQKRLSAGDKADNRMNPMGTAGWAIMNAEAAYVWKSIRLAVQAQNLGDVDYRMHGSGINGVGRSVWAQLQCSF